MRYSTLVFAAIVAVLASFGPSPTAAQRDRPVQKNPSPVIEVKPVEDIVVDYLANSDRERGEDESGAYVMGRVTDFGGRSVRGAEVVLFSLDSDDVKRVVTNGFGYYRFQDLNLGESYLISVQHRRYLFVGGSTSFIVEGEPIQIDFQAEMR
jgi:hypothetical protein